MWRPVIVTTAAAAEPVTLEDAKAHLRVDGTSEDDLITTLITAARGHVESRTGTRLYTQTVTLRTDDWTDLYWLPVAPVASITSIAYVDTDGTTQTLATSVYEARLWGLEPSIVLKYNQVWPTIRVGSLITIVAVVGYGTSGAQPPETIHALKLALADLYAFRETTLVGDTASVIPSAASIEALLANHKLHLI